MHASCSSEVYQTPAEGTGDEFGFPSDHQGQTPSHSGRGMVPTSWLGPTALINFTLSQRVTELSAQSDGPRQDMMHWSNWRRAQRQQRRFQLICSWGASPLGIIPGLYIVVGGTTVWFYFSSQTQLYFFHIENTL